MDRHVLSVRMLFDTAEDAQRAASAVEASVSGAVAAEYVVSPHDSQTQGSASAVPREPKGGV